VTLRANLQQVASTIFIVCKGFTGVRMDSPVLLSLIQES